MLCFRGYPASYPHRTAGYLGLRTTIMLPNRSSRPYPPPAFPWRRGATEGSFVEQLPHRVANVTVVDMANLPVHPPSLQCHRWTKSTAKLCRYGSTSSLLQPIAIMCDLQSWPVDGSRRVMWDRQGRLALGLNRANSPGPCRLSGIAVSKLDPSGVPSERYRKHALLIWRFRRSPAISRQVTPHSCSLGVTPLLLWSPPGRTPSFHGIMNLETQNVVVKGVIHAGRMTSTTRTASSLVTAAAAWCQQIYFDTGDDCIKLPPAGSVD